MGKFYQWISWPSVVVVFYIQYEALWKSWITIIFPFLFLCFFLFFLCPRIKTFCPVLPHHGRRQADPTRSVVEEQGASSTLKTRFPRWKLLRLKIPFPYTWRRDLRLSKAHTSEILLVLMVPQPLKELLLKKKNSTRSSPLQLPEGVPEFCSLYC